MDPLHFSITPEAARFLQHLIRSAKADEDLVMTIAPETDVIPLNASIEALGPAIAEIVGAARKDGFAKLEFRWAVGASRRSRFPPEDIFIFDGIPCFAPKEMRSVLNGRKLVLNDGKLRLVPEPPPPKGSGPQ